MDKPTLEQIKSYLETGDWYELLPSSQWECMEWLISEVERYCSNQPQKRAIESIELMIAVEDAAYHCRHCNTDSFCPKHDKAWWEFWRQVKENLTIYDISE